MVDSRAVSRRERTLGALLGVHAGDCLGATVEFQSWEDIKNDYPRGVRDIVGGGVLDWPPGHATDDTDLTRAVLLAYRDAEELKRSRPTEQPDVVKLAAQYMVEWYDGRWPGRTPGQIPRDIGGATATAMSNFKRTNDPRASGAGEGRAGNGSLMRCIPTALFQPDAAKALLTESLEISAITHDDYHCTIACAAYNAMVRVLVDGGSADEAWQAGKSTAAQVPSLAAAGPAAAPKEKMERAARKVEAAIDAGKRLVRLQDLAENGPKNANKATEVLPFKGSGYVLESLTLAVAAMLDPRPLEDVLVDVVRFGQDADSNGAIAGGLLGARDGVGAIPLRWRELLQFGKEFTEVTDYLLSCHSHGSSG
ncbi:ADP-ribosylation/Crystallin J1 [Thermothelomyces heterothallicus CBS 202.75]|uniref:ADP-ribosylation/Crystallin J1 n=1 Tax=Thermothelomyces heterothallicus CBS 202.75 TaxID=1149848 RepID=UPI00374200FD